MRTAVVCGVVLVASGCAMSRVSLRPVPEATAPLKERQRAWEDLAPSSALQTTYLQRGAVVGQSLDYLILGDGTRVADPRDLLPAVDADSPTARAVARFEEKYDAARTQATAGWVIFGVGGVALSASPLLLGGLGGSRDMSPAFVAIGASAAVMLVGTIVALVASGRLTDAGHERLSAFSTYPLSLRRRLALDEPAQSPSPAPAPDSVSLPLDAPVRVSALVP
jgi:hypothetical protein